VTRSSSTFISLVVVATVSATSGCGKTADRTGDETHFQTCAVDDDCRNANPSYKCELGVCRAPSDGGAKRSAQDGGPNGRAGAGGTGTGGAQQSGSGGQSSGGQSSGGQRDGGQSSGGQRDGGQSDGARHDGGQVTDVADATPDVKTAITPDEVSCGTIPACQPPVIKCCSGTSSPGSGGCAPTSGVCSSNISLECDGPEDCTSGICSGEPYGGGVQTLCKADRGTYLMCHDHTQCPGATPNCCPIFTDQFKPYLRECDTRTTLSAGPCDTP
jgi:hypothetical protein